MVSNVLDDSKTNKLKNKSLCFKCLVSVMVLFVVHKFFFFSTTKSRRGLDQVRPLSFSTLVLFSELIHYPPRKQTEFPTVG